MNLKKGGDIERKALKLGLFVDRKLKIGGFEMKSRIFFYFVAVVLVGIVTLPALAQSVETAAKKSGAVSEPEPTAKEDPLNDYGKLKIVCGGPQGPGDTMWVTIAAEAGVEPVEAIGIGELLYPACLTPVDVEFFGKAASADFQGWHYESWGSRPCENSNTLHLGILFSYESNPAAFLQPGDGEQSLAQIDFEIREDASSGTYPLSIPNHQAEFTVSGGTRNEPTIEIVDSIRVGIYAQEEGSTLPKTFALSQNYPNPFNPITVIRYALPRNCWVRLELYNILGQKVATLVDGQQKAGYKIATWDASSFSSGIYFYRLKAGDFMEARKMALLR